MKKKEKNVDVTEVVEPVVENVEETVEPVVEETVVENVEENVEETVEPVVEETVEENVEPVVEEVTEDNIPDPTNFVEGVVVKCTKLNVRENPSKDANVVKILDRKTSVMIDIEKSTDDFYFVYTLDFEGYCVKDFLEIK